MLELLRVMGKLGIAVWCYNWMAVVPWSRTSVALPGRGGAEVTAFDAAVWDDAPAPGAPVAEEKLWETLAWFLERVVPVAEAAGRQARPPPRRPAALTRPRHRPHHHEPRRLRPRLRAPAERRPTG